MSNSSIWHIDRTLSGATTPSQSGHRSNGNEEVICIPQSSSITGAAPSDCLMFISGHTLGEVGLFTPLQRCSRYILQLQPTGLSKKKEKQYIFQDMLSIIIIIIIIIVIIIIDLHRYADRIIAVVLWTIASEMCWINHFISRDMFLERAAFLLILMVCIPIMPNVLTATSAARKLSDRNAYLFRFQSSVAQVVDSRIGIMWQIHHWKYFTASGIQYKWLATDEWEKYNFVRSFAVPFVKAYEFSLGMEKKWYWSFFMKHHENTALWQARIKISYKRHHPKIQGIKSKKSH